MRLFAKCTDINIKCTSGNIKPESGCNLAKVSMPWAQRYSNGARGVLTYARLLPLFGLIIHDKNLMRFLVCLVELLNDTIQALYH